jgi:transposase
MRLCLPPSCTIWNSGCDLEQLLGRNTMENEILKEALELARAKKAIVLSSSVPWDGSR